MLTCILSSPLPIYMSSSTTNSRSYSEHQFVVIFPHSFISPTATTTTTTHHLPHSLAPSVPHPEAPAPIPPRIAHTTHHTPHPSLDCADHASQAKPYQTNPRLTHIPIPASAPSPFTQEEQAKADEWLMAQISFLPSSVAVMGAAERDVTIGRGSARGNAREEVLFVLPFAHRSTSAAEGMESRR